MNKINADEDGDDHQQFDERESGVDATDTGFHRGWVSDGCDWGERKARNSNFDSTVYLRFLGAIVG
jgi:hypothetical protein